MMYYMSLIEKLINSEEYRNSLELPKQRIEEYEFLAKGEYNVNLLFFHPIWNKKLILRINYASQMNLIKQASYEAYALKLLEKSNRTPKIYYLDDSKKYIDKGILVIEYLNGHSLDYRNEIFRVTNILANIHTLECNNNELIKSDNSMKFMLDECDNMLDIYLNSDIAKNDIKSRLKILLSKARKIEKQNNFDNEYKCIINTELNSTNFLMNTNENDYLIDWEKPIYSLPAQDLGHFLAPTTTFWKTDIILEKNIIDAFIDKYLKLVDSYFDVKYLKEATYIFIKLNCIRGLTWCAMAYVQYLNSKKEILNESTKIKLESYLSDEFLTKIEKIYN